MKRIVWVMLLAAFLAPSGFSGQEDGESPCPMGFGAGLDAAKDEDGKKWGVVVLQVIPGGRAHEMGLQADDVIVAVDGESLLTEVEEGEEAEDPYDVLVRLLTALECGQRATLDYVRDGNTYQARFSVPYAEWKEPRP